MTDALTQLRDALETVITTSEHALVPRTLLRELLARLEAAEAVVEAAEAVVEAAEEVKDAATEWYAPHNFERNARRNHRADASLSRYIATGETLSAALSTHAKLKDATHD